MKHEGKIVVITGGSGGIGQEMCKRFCEEGAKVFFTYVSRKRIADTFVDEMHKEGYETEAIKCDVRNSYEVKTIFHTILRKTGGIDILVNNAGISQDSLLYTMNNETWENVLNVNLNGTFYCMKEVIPLMMEKGKGIIINISSIMGSVGWPGLSHYAASKAGIDALTRGAAAELGRFNIRVNSIAPGMLATEMSENAISKLGNKVKKITPLRRYGITKDVADLANFLASDEANYITGEVYMVRGGLGAGLTIS